MSTSEYSLLITAGYTPENSLSFAGTTGGVFKVSAFLDSGKGEDCG